MNFAGNIIQHQNSRNFLVQQPLNIAMLPKNFAPKQYSPLPNDRSEQLQRSWIEERNEGAGKIFTAMFDYGTVIRSYDGRQWKIVWQLEPLPAV